MEDFKFITHTNHDPYFNIASEEYLLKKKGGYFVYLWINSPAVIVGVNQNTLQEVNINYTEKNGIKIVRRLTGGGAVYHDLKNVCYTVIAPFDETRDNYKAFTAPVIGYLAGIGVKAEFSGRNDITVDGKKISGNAQTVYKDRILHHGTLLFDTDFTALENSLKPNKLKMESKGIKSVRARVGNVREYVSGMTAQQFYDGLCDFFARQYPTYSFDDKDLYEINKLVAEKYSRYEWNIGRSPKGQNLFEDRFSFGTLSLSFDTVEGKMQNVSVFGDFFSLMPKEGLENKLNGTPFNVQSVLRALSDAGDYIKGATAEEIVGKLF